MHMPNVAVVTDSVASIPEDLLDRLQINWVAYFIHRGSEVLRDLVTIQREEFFGWLPTARDMPQTACPGPGDYLQMYERLVTEQGAREIVSVHMTSIGSGAYQAARAAQAMALEHLPKVRIEVIDTRNAAMAHGWSVIEAARAALAGLRLEEVVERVRTLIPLCRMILTADTLRYLYMGGRIGQAARLVGTALNIKPLIGMEDGVIVALGQARSRSQAYQKIVEMVESFVGPQGRVRIAFMHAAAREEAEKLRTLVEARVTSVESLIAELSPALGVHSGPGTAGVCFFPVRD
jgi:DegV family protein with EDD domain